jgi:hypothetical protein
VHHLYTVGLLIHDHVHHLYTVGLLVHALVHLLYCRVADP